MTVAMWTTRMTTFMTDQLRECPFCNGDGWIIRVPDTKRFRPQCMKCGVSFGEFDRESDAKAAWNTRPTAVASHAEDAVAEVCYDSYGFGRMVWRKQFGKGNQPPHGSLLYTQPPRSGDEAEPTVRNFRIVEDARDAARYRWLRQPNAIRREAHIAVLTENGGYVATEEMADRAIDAAMAARGDDK